MRHLGGIVVGLFGAVVGIVVIAAALGLTRRALEQFSQAPMVLGAVLLLIGGIAIGAVIVFRRLSVAAPLTAAAVMVVLTVAGFLQPPWNYQLGLGGALGGGLDVFVGLQLPALLAGVFLLTSLGIAVPRDRVQNVPPVAAPDVRLSRVDPHPSEVPGLGHGAHDDLFHVGLETRDRRSGARHDHS